jgi:hypothetical protein
MVNTEAWSYTELHITVQGYLYRFTYSLHLAHNCTLHIALLGLTSLLEVPFQERVFPLGEAELETLMDVLPLVKLSVGPIYQHKSLFCRVFIV